MGINTKVKTCKNMSHEFTILNSRLFYLLCMQFGQAKILLAFGLNAPLTLNCSRYRISPSLVTITIICGHNNNNKQKEE